MQLEAKTVLAYEIWNTDFNSILVQLEEDLQLQDRQPPSEFQFHIGAIRRLSPAIRDEGVDVFQFHIGAIRSGVTATVAKYATLDFNSILVQLEVLLPCYMAQKNHDFNSILVQLEETPVFEWVREKAYFNSILVQLEAIRKSLLNMRVITFQFHIGAIRRSLNRASL